MLMLQDAPANTNVYMIAGYAVIFGVMLIYLVSLIVRRRNLQAEYDLLSEEEDQKKSSAAE